MKIYNFYWIYNRLNYKLVMEDNLIYLTFIIFMFIFNKIIASIMNIIFKYCKYFWFSLIELIILK